MSQAPADILLAETVRNGRLFIAAHPECSERVIVTPRNAGLVVPGGVRSAVATPEFEALAASHGGRSMYARNLAVTVDYLLAKAATR